MRESDGRMETPMWFRVWFAFCALLGLSMLGLVAWAIVRVVTHYTGG